MFSKSDETRRDLEEELFGVRQRILLAKTRLAGLIREEERLKNHLRRTVEDAKELDGRRVTEYGHD